MHDVEIPTTLSLEKSMLLPIKHNNQFKFRQRYSGKMFDENIIYMYSVTTMTDLFWVKIICFMCNVTKYMVLKSR
jgi:hypothetical protein